MLKYVPEFLKTYALIGNDMRAVHDYIDCESREAISSLKAEFTAIAQGAFTLDYLDKSLGGSRKIKFGSHEQWAKNMLLWMAAKKD